MILVDTSVWIDYFNGIDTWQTASLDGALSRDWILMGDVILAELLQGFEREADYEKARKALDHLECVDLCGKELAIKAASNFRFLRARGVTIRKTVDMIIGTWCMETSVSLLHNDRDFDQIALYLPLKTVSGDPGVSLNEPVREYR